MEQLQRKVQQRKGQADTVSSSKPCLAVLLASAAKKVCPPMLTSPVMASRQSQSIDLNPQILQDLTGPESAKDVFRSQSIITTK